MGSQFDSTWSTQENGFALGAEVVYQSISFAWHILPVPEGAFNITPWTTIPTRRKKMNVTNYNNGVARTWQAVKCNFLLNKKMDAWSSNWWTWLQVTIPLELVASGAGAWISALTHSCILKKISTGWSVTTLKTLTLVSTTKDAVTGITYYTFSDNTGIGTINAGDVIFLEYTVTYTAGAHTNTGSVSNVSIITNWSNNLFASIP